MQLISLNTEIDGIITSVSVQDIIDATILGPSFLAQLTGQGAYCTRTDTTATAPLSECFRNPINGNDSSLHQVQILSTVVYLLLKLVISMLTLIWF